MLGLLKRFVPGEVEVEFCDRCGSVCDRRCRANEIRDGYRDEMLRIGWRLA